MVVEDGEARGGDEGEEDGQGAVPAEPVGFDVCSGGGVSLFLFPSLFSFFLTDLGAPGPAVAPSAAHLRVWVARRATAAVVMIAIVVARFVVVWWLATSVVVGGLVGYISSSVACWADFVCVCGYGLVGGARVVKRKPLVVEVFTKDQSSS